MEAVDIVKVLGDGAGQVRALKGVSLALTGGELTLLMGPSGSGKTTLLSILGCMLTPTEGTVRVARPADRRRRPGGAGQAPAREHRLRVPVLSPVPDADALDNVRLALDVRGENSHRAMQKSKEALARSAWRTRWAPIRASSAAASSSASPSRAPSSATRR